MNWQRHVFLLYLLIGLLLWRVLPSAAAPATPPPTQVATGLTSAIAVLSVTPTLAASSLAPPPQPELTIAAVATLAPTRAVGGVIVHAQSAELLATPLIIGTAALAQAGPGDELLDCQSGRTIILAGLATPTDALLVRFGERIVGGGVVDARGAYAIPLAIGDEQADGYSVRLERRADGALIGERTCASPEASQTIVSVPSGQALPSATATSASAVPAPTATGSSDRAGCDPSYPDVCIAPPPPDLNCDDIALRNFRVIGDDPHKFDTDDDGIGCEA